MFCPKCVGRATKGLKMELQSYHYAERPYEHLAGETYPDVCAEEYKCPHCGTTVRLAQFVAVVVGKEDE